MADTVGIWYSCHQLSFWEVLHPSGTVCLSRQGSPQVGLANTVQMPTCSSCWGSVVDGCLHGRRILRAEDRLGLGQLVCMPAYPAQPVPHVRCLEAAAIVSNDGDSSHHHLENVNQSYSSLK